MTVKGSITIGGGVVLLLSAGVGLSGCATVPGTGEAPRATVGTVLHFTRTKAGKTDTFRHKIVARSGDELVYHVTHESQEPDNDQVRLYGGIFSYAYWRPGRGWAEYKFDKRSVSRLLPFKVGTRSEFPVTFGYAEAETEAVGKKNWKATERGRMVFTVRRAEKITVPAGTFDTFVIHRVRRFRHIAPPHRRVAAERVSWYAPSLGYVVKQTTQSLKQSRKGGLVPSGPILEITLQKIDRPGSR